MDSGYGNFNNLIGAYGEDPVVAMRRNGRASGKGTKSREHQDVAVPPETRHLQTSPAALRQAHHGVQVTGEGGTVRAPLGFMHHLDPSVGDRLVDDLKTPTVRGSAPTPVMVSEQQTHVEVS